MGELAILCHEGDTKLMWDANIPDEVANAKRTFEDLTKKGYTAFRTKGKDGEKGTRMDTFDPTAERIILVPRLVGG